MSINRDNIINKIKPAGSTGAEYIIAPTLMVDTTTNYSASLPTLTEDSIIALTSDLPTNYVTLDTAQTISGAKTFSASPILNNSIAMQGKNTSGNVYSLIAVDGNNNVPIGSPSLNDICVYKTLRPSSTAANQADLGYGTNVWRDLYLGGAIKTTAYTFNLPSASGTLALTSQLPTVNNGTLTVQTEGTQKGTFTANQSGNTTINITAADLGLSSALKFIGVTTTAISDGSTTNPIVIGSSSVTAVNGNVAIYGNKEFLWNGTLSTPSWEELGDESSYALKTITITGTGVLGGGGALSNNQTITHSEVLGTAQTTAKVFKTKIDKYGHISEATAATYSDVDAQQANNTLTSLAGLSTSSTGLVKLTNGTASLDTTSYISNVKVLKTDNTTAQTVSSSEAINGSGTINLHKVAKTGTYSDLIGTPAAVSLTTTAGSEKITVGSSSLNVVTRDTAQTISGAKNFTGAVPVTPTAKGVQIGLQADNTNNAYISLASASGAAASYIDLGTVNNDWNFRIIKWFNQSSGNYAQFSYSGGQTGTITIPSGKTDTMAVVGDIKDATLTITQNSTSIGTFTANASSNKTIDVVTPKVMRFI